MIAQMDANVFVDNAKVMAKGQATIPKDEDMEELQIRDVEVSTTQNFIK